MGLLYLYMYIYHKKSSTISCRYLYHRSMDPSWADPTKYDLPRISSHEGTEAAEKNAEMTGDPLYGCFLKWWYPQNTPKWSFLVGKPMVVGYHRNLGKSPISGLPWNNDISPTTWFPRNFRRFPLLFTSIWGENSCEVHIIWPAYMESVGQTKWWKMLDHTPLKTNMTGWKISIFNRTYIFLHGGCSIVMLIFRGVAGMIRASWVLICWNRCFLLKLFVRTCMSQIDPNIKWSFSRIKRQNTCFK